MMRAWALVIFATALLLPLPAAADDAPEIIAVPLFGEVSLAYGGWAEIAVRIRNPHAAPLEGEVRVEGGSMEWSSGRVMSVTAPFRAAGKSSVSLRVPIKLSEIDDPSVEVSARDGTRLYRRSFSRSGDNRGLLVNVSPSPALGPHLNGAFVSSRIDPWAHPHGYGAPSSSPSTVTVQNALYDASTGDPLLPRHAAGYARVASMVLPSAELTRLRGAELEALAGYVLGGGTLALVISRPEDLRHENLTALVGGEVRPSAVAVETLRELVLAAPRGSYFGHSAPLPHAAAPEPELMDKLSGYDGGNLRPSAYGASASYGLGEVHLLAFDPNERPAVDSPWVHVRMLDLVRRASERVSSVLFRPGSVHTVVSEVRRHLDPNESSRWAIVLSALILCLYAVLAGPVSFTHWRKKHRPLMALVTLPLLSVSAFGVVAVIGVVAKGCSGRARHLTVVEAGAGMSLGTARRWRAFFVPSQQEITVRATNASSVLGSEQLSHGDEVKDRLALEPAGLSIVDLKLRPWETAVVREDGFAQLGQGVALVRVSDGETTVINRTGRPLRGLVLSQPNAGERFLERLEDGARVSSRDFAPLTGVGVPSGASTPGLRLYDFQPYALHSQLDQSAIGLFEAWLAVLDAVGGPRDWFPLGVPVLLAQLDGGEGRSSDTGLGIDSDRVLIRVVGYGGAP